MRWTGVVALLAALLETPPPPPTFTTSVETVYVDAFVTHAGAPVANLTAADFDVRDDGVRQEVRLEDIGRIPITATLALDVSASVQGERLKQLRVAAHSFVDHLEPADQVGLLAFSHELRLAIPHTRDAVRLHRGIDAFSPRGSTSLYDALYASLLLPVGPGRSLIVAFTDGEDTLSWTDAKQVLAVAEASNALVHVVGIWPPSDVGPVETPPARHREALARIARATGGRIWSAQADSLPKTFVSILDELRARYLLAYEPRGGPREGRHRLEIRVRGGKGRVRARTAYFVAPRR